MELALVYFFYSLLPPCWRYIEGLKDMAKPENARIVFVPGQSSRVLASVGAIREILSGIQGKT